jgi:hypothetical protein
MLPGLAARPPSCAERLANSYPALCKITDWGRILGIYYNLSGTILKVVVEPFALREVISGSAPTGTLVGYDRTIQNARGEQHLNVWNSLTRIGR